MATMLGRSRRTALALVAAGALVSWVPPAAAQSVTEISLAETLYRQARELSAAGNHAEACPKFAESYRLDPGTGTLLNLAACHEAEGKVATAWLEFSEALAQAKRDRRQSRITFAEEHIAVLEPKLSRLTIALGEGVTEPGLELILDGVAVGPAALGVPTPVDPGLHVVEAKAPGKLAFSAKIEIGASADQQTVTIPALEAAPSPPAPPPAPPPVVAVVPPPAPATREAPRERPIPMSVYVAGGVTAALVIGAGVTGGIYLDERALYNANKTEDRRDAARTLGVVNLGLWIASAAGAGLTTYFYLTRPEVPSARGSLELSGWATADSAGLVARGEL